MQTQPTTLKTQNVELETLQRRKRDFLNITLTIWGMKGGHNLWKNGISKAQHVVLLLGNSGSGQSNSWLVRKFSVEEKVFSCKV